MNDIITTPLPSSFEDALKELESIVKQLEDGRIPLEESLKLYERGHALRIMCEDSLKSARLRIEEVTKNTDGSPVIQASSLDVDNI